MARTESKILTCHPNDEQEIINAMQKFHWSLLSSQDVKTMVSSIERGTWGDNNLYSVIRSQQYVKLAFSRDVDLPHLDEIRKLETAYHGLPAPAYPKKLSVFFSIFFSVIGALLIGIGLQFCAAMVWVGLQCYELYPDNEGGYYLSLTVLYSLAFAFLCVFPIFSGCWAWRRFYLLSYKPKLAEAKRVAESNEQERRRILSEVEKFN